MERLLNEQEDVLYTISRSLENFKKLGAKNQTPAITRNRLMNLKELWQRCRQLHADIKSVATKEERTTLAYFKDKQFATAEDNFVAASDYMAETLDKWTENLPATVLNPNPAVNAQNSTTVVPLPRINLPKFSGNYTEWTNFRDLFTSLVVNNQSLSNVQRLHYLKSSLIGDAGLVIKNFSVTDANYDAAWEELLTRFENTRSIVTAHLNLILDLPPMKGENALELKRVYDTVNDALHALRNLGRPADDDFVVAVTIRKLDTRTIREWELSLGDNTKPPLFDELGKFLVSKLRALEAIQEVKDHANNKVNRFNTTKSLVSSVQRGRCVSCQDSHSLYQCPQFKSLSLALRKQLVQKQRCCYNCFGKGHSPKNCLSQKRCAHCQSKHHTLLHGDEQASLNKTNSEPSSTEEVASVNATNKSQSAVSLRARVANKPSPLLPSAILATARVLVRSDEGRSLKLRALIDNGSEATFITEYAAQILKSKRQKTKIRVNGLGDRCSNVANYRTTISLNSCYNVDAKPVVTSALILPKLTLYSTEFRINQKQFSHLQDLAFADPDPSSRDPIDLLIGADLYGTILLDGVRKGSNHEPTAQRTIFGWVLFGPCTSNRPIISDNTETTGLHLTVAPLVDELLCKFWELEEVPNATPLSEEDSSCEEHFKRTHSRLSDGRYVVRLPFKPDVPRQFTGSIKAATHSLARLEARFAKDPQLKQGYHGFLDKYERLGHMARVSPEDLNKVAQFYLPHHPVFRKESSTSPIRVVFNASCRPPNGVSLNESLLTGPKLQSDLSSIILRWRSHRLVFVADIAKMFRQIWVHPEDIDYQRILWRTSCSKPVEHYCLLTVTYGTAPAPFLAMRVLRQLCEDEGLKFPLAADVLQSSIYVDDVLFGADDVSTILKTRNQLNSLLSTGGFHLRKWASNYEELLRDMDPSDKLDSSSLPFQDDSTIKTLGLAWNPKLDCFTFQFKATDFTEVTKRTVLSIVSCIFDPLGLIAPVLISAKIFLQELWIRKLDWDSRLPLDLEEKWNLFAQDLKRLTEISIPRWNFQSPDSIGLQLHGFADASNRAYAAVVYLRVTTPQDTSHSTLLYSKTKVAPIKTISVPKLELCAASLLARVLVFILQTFNLIDIPIFCWSDSTIILAWLSKHPSQWPTFVANRVSDIHTRLPKARWRYVNTKQNPADCASRRIDVANLKENSLWWNGPSWLIQPSTCWPESPRNSSPFNASEQKVVPVLLTKCESSEWPLVDQVSWPRLLRITALCLVFVDKSAKRLGNASSPVKTLSQLLTEYIKRAQKFWLSKAQTSQFLDDIRALQTQRSVPTSSKLASLNPFLDSDGLLRVGGRLKYSPFSYDEKHPIVLPRHRIARIPTVYCGLAAVSNTLRSLTMRNIPSSYRVTE